LKLTKRCISRPSIVSNSALLPFSPPYFIAFRQI
jgi:hypothetical protein